MAKKKKNRINVVYSTNPDYDFDTDEEVEDETLPVAEQLLYVSIDRKNRKGKPVVMIENFIGSSDDLKDLCKDLKSKCGVGGNTKDGNILIQGDNRPKVLELLDKMGYSYKKKGG